MFYRVFKNCYLYNGTNGEVGQTGVSVEREFQRLCKENNVEQLLQDEVKSELQEDNPTTDMGDFERSMQQFSHDGGKKNVLNICLISLKVLWMMKSFWSMITSQSLGTNEWIWEIIKEGNLVIYPFYSERIFVSNLLEIDLKNKM